MGETETGGRRCEVRDRLPAHNLEAELEDIAVGATCSRGARKAGIEGDNISVTGPAADEAAEAASCGTSGENAWNRRYSREAHGAANAGLVGLFCV